jgi:YaiO family outer membrane protein
MTLDLLSRRMALALLGSLALVAPAAAQAEDPDALFEKARSLPKERREEARALCRRALERSPEYTDIRIYLARLHAWDAQYDDARREIRAVLAANPKDAEAREVAIDVEVWSDHPHEALRLCDAAMGLDPRDPLWPYRKARVLRSLKDIPGALASAQVALQLDPNHQPSRLLRDDLKELLQRSKVYLTATYDTYSETFTPWKTVNLGVGHRFDAGLVLLQVNRADLFNTWGTQVEVDAYPHIAEGTYAYLSAAHSSDSIFPNSSFAADLYHNFPAAIEASLGVRRLVFAEAVTVYTGSIGRYVGNSLYTIRLYDTPSALGASLSGTLSARFFQEDADNYINVAVGTGMSPDQQAWTAEILRLHSRNVSIGLQERLARSWYGTASALWEHQEFLPDQYRIHWSFSAGLEWRF